MCKRRRRWIVFGQIIFFPLVVIFSISCMFINDGYVNLLAILIYIVNIGIIIKSSFNVFISDDIFLEMVDKLRNPEAEGKRPNAKGKDKLRVACSA